MRCATGRAGEGSTPRQRRRTVRWGSCRSNTLGLRQLFESACWLKRRTLTEESEKDKRTTACDLHSSLRQALHGVHLPELLLRGIGCEIDAHLAVLAVASSVELATGDPGRMRLATRDMTYGILRRATVEEEDLLGTREERLFNKLTEAYSLNK